MVHALEEDNQHPSVRALQRGKSFHKVVHNISLWLALTIFASRLLSLLLRPLPLLLLTERGASLHGHERCAARLEPRRNPAQRLALSALLLVFPRTEVFLAASRVGRDHRVAIGLHFKNVRHERRCGMMGFCCIGPEINRTVGRIYFRAYIGRETSICAGGQYCGEM